MFIKTQILGSTLQGINISHLGKFGKSSTQNAIFGGYVSFLGGNKNWENGIIFLHQKGHVLKRGLFLPPVKLQNKSKYRVQQSSTSVDMVNISLMYKDMELKKQFKIDVW